jgi:beta-galactosidase
MTSKRYDRREFVSLSSITAGGWVTRSGWRALAEANPKVFSSGSVGTRSFNLGWRFHNGDAPGAQLPAFNDRDWRVVDLPHDWSIEGNTPGSVPFDKSMPAGRSAGYLHGGTGWYRNEFVLSPADAGNGVELTFDGVQQESDVWINGRYLGFQPHGYIGFTYGLTKHIGKPGERNVIAVRAVNPEMNSRWYAGSGIYRNVSLRMHGLVYVPAYGLRVDTVRLDEQRAVLEIRVEVRNTQETPQQVALVLNLSGPDGNTKSFQLADLNLAPESDEQVSEQVTVASPRLWSPNSPDLYDVEIQIKQSGGVLDAYRKAIGIRTISLSAESGLLLNGEPIKLKGGCMHHDNGLLGAAAFADAEYRRVAIMRRNGFNAVRTSHNPPSTAFLDACDRLGMMVMDEFTDMWEMPKKPNGYSRYFARHWKKDLGAMIARDYNHPSVVIWSIGNEIPERIMPSGLEIGREMASAIRELDSSRPITNAIQSFSDYDDKRLTWDASAPAFAFLDLAGYNYTWSKYEGDHVKFPARVMVETESNPDLAYETWRQVEEHSYVVGDFVWTGMDHIGESGIGDNRYIGMDESPPDRITIARPWPTWVNWCGDIDITGNKKPQSYYRDVVWGESKVEIAVHAPVPEGMWEITSYYGWPEELPSWNWSGSEGKALLVKVYSRAERVRLELNGRVIGEQSIDPKVGITASFRVPYQAGVLRAMALASDEAVATCVLKTSGAAAMIVLLPERTRGDADRERLIYIPIEIRDAVGSLVPDAGHSLQLALTGPVELMALGSANPDLAPPLKDLRAKAFRGRALAILRSTGKSGRVRLSVTSPGLVSSEIVLQMDDPRNRSSSAPLRVRAKS